MLTVLFATASAHSLTADLDADGTPETVQAGVDEQARIWVSVEEDGRERRVALEPFVDIEGPRRDFTLEAVTVQESGVPMLLVHVPAGPYCGSGNDWVYLSYTNGSLQPALALSDFADAPVWSTVEARFDPKRKRVKVVKQWGEAERRRGRHAETLRFVDGVYE